MRLINGRSEIMRGVLYLCLVFVAAVSAQVKIFIDTDLEGVSGVFKFSQTREKDTPANIQACEYFMGDLAAVIRGLRDGGATEIIVNDGHGNQAILPHLMEPGAKYVTGKPRPEGNRWNLDESCAGLVMFGYHAMNGTPDGVLHHTQSSLTEKKFWYNGIECGELVQTAAVAGHFGVPPILVTGDEATCREAVRFLGNEIVTVATKQGLAREAAVLYPFAETRKALYEGAKKAMAAIPRCKPFIMKPPIQVKMQFLEKDSDQPEPTLKVKEWVAQDALHLLAP
ncbi:M55 family metallopeptidase [bacterium]|nr:M55 family metallopeptidase [bacterium]